MDDIKDVPMALKNFYTNSIRLLRACTKPNKKGAAAHFAPLCTAFRCFPTIVWRTQLPSAVNSSEFMKTAAATAIGFAIIGFIGFFVKLIHIPINNIIVGS
eukprot:SAG31_NODE_2971_length_4839_cov_1.617722_1_plen_101_part_00